MFRSTLPLNQQNMSQPAAVHSLQTAHKAYQA